jgi:hypothetical protein
LTNADNLTDLAFVRWNVDFAAVYRYVAVSDELPRLSAGFGKPQAKDNVVKPHLEDAQQVFAGRPTTPHRFAKVAAELPLEYTVGVACLLFFSQLDAVLGLLAATGGLMPRRIWPSAGVNRALRRKAPVALQKELDSFPPAELTYWTGITSHEFFSPS